MQLMPAAFCLARANAGNNMAAKMAMMAITTNNSIKVNAALTFRVLDVTGDFNVKNFISRSYTPRQFHIGQ